MKERRRKQIKAFFLSLFPPLKWMPNYFRNFKQNFVSDFIAGLTIGVMVVPQALSYSIIAGLPAIYGLYSAIIPPLVYFLLGTSREINIGTTAVLSLLTNDALRFYPEYGTDDIVKISLMLSFLSGLFQMIMGFLRFGFVTNFLSHTLLSGFTSAAGLIIIVNQMKTIFGLKVGDTNVFILQIYNFFTSLHTTNYITLIIGIFSIILLMLQSVLKKKFKWIGFIPIALFLIMFSTLLSYKTQFEQHGIEILKKIPGGLPPLSLPSFPKGWETMVITSFVLAMMGYLEHISIGTKFAQMNRYELNPNQELIALGSSNLIGSFFSSSIPCTGSFSRTAVNAIAGARSGFSSLVSVIIVLIVITTLTSVLYYIPKVILASIVIVAAAAIIDIKEIPKLSKKSKKEIAVWVFTFVATLVLGVEIGILCSVGFSFMVLIFQIAFPDTIVLGRLPGLHHIYREVNKFPNSLVNPSISIVRIDAPLCFLNVSFVSNFFKEIYLNNPPKVIVMDWSSVCYIDISGYKVLKRAIDDAKRNNIFFLHAQIKGSVSENLKKYGLLNSVNTDHIFFELHDAVLCASGIVREWEKKERSMEDDFMILEIDDELAPNSGYSPLIYSTNEEEEEKKCIIF